MTTAQGAVPSTLTRHPAPDPAPRSGGAISFFGSLGSTSAKVAWGGLAGHILALIFGLLGLLVAIPNPDLWADSEYGIEVYNFGIENGGVLHIVLGAVCVFALGVLVLGFARTAVFFILSTVLSAGSELIGTGTGWPFGNYEYEDGLGYKLLDRVPFTIPLSWFYMGLACYLFARVVVALVGRRLGPTGKALWSVGLGTYFVVVWDLVLDPAMAHEDLVIQFWTWGETGPYFGMPLQNYVGWGATALAYIGISRLLWGEDPDPTKIPVALPALVIFANLVFASGLSLSVGLWIPVVLAFGLTALPIWYFLRVRRTTSPEQPLGRSWLGLFAMR